MSLAYHDEVKMFSETMPTVDALKVGIYCRMREQEILVKKKNSKSKKSSSVIGSFMGVALAHL